MEVTNWIVKVSKLCNLRCRYCYEWDELAKTDRIELHEWRRLLVEVRSYHEERSRELGRTIETRIIWHGGEPLLLPQEYFAEVLALQREIFGEGLRVGAFQNHIQTNLFRFDRAKIELLHGAGFFFGVSMDVVGGVRLTLGGRRTEARVAANLDELRALGVRSGGIVVVAGHTVKHLRAIYEFYRDNDAPVSLLPLFDAPNNTPDAPFAVTHRAIVDALCDLFVAWYADDEAVPVSPLLEYLEVVSTRWEGRQRPLYDRRQGGEWALLVNTDGGLFQAIDAYDPRRSLGNCFQQSIDEILASPAYEASLERDAEIFARHCDGCEWLGACSRLPVVECQRSGAQERCPIAFATCGFIDAYLREQGVSSADLRRRIGELAG